MDKNYNIEIFFESLKKSFNIFSKKTISFEELRQKTIKEFKISKEYEKDMRFYVNVKNRTITIFNDNQILNNFEEMTQNYFYLKIFFNINNNNYINNSPSNQKEIEINIKPCTSDQFSIISNNNNLEYYKDLEKKYIEEINKLKEELEKVKNERTNKGEIDIRKFDEKYRDLSNKNNILEQKITELENENKTLKINKNIITENISFENRIDNDNIKEIEKIISKIIGEHEDHIIREITGLKNTVDYIQKDQKVFYEQFNNNLYNKMYNTDDKITLSQREKTDILKNEQSIINNEENKNINKMNSIENLDDNFDVLDNMDTITNDKEDNKKTIQNLNNKSKDDEQEAVPNNSKNSKIKRNINFFKEDEKNTKSFDNSKNKNKVNNQNIDNEKPDILKEIRNSFIENGKKKNDNLLTKKNSNYMDTEQFYSKYTAPSKNKIMEKMKIKNQKHVFNYSNVNKKDISDEDIINYESASDINTDTKNLHKNQVNTSNSQKNFFIKIEDKRKSGINSYLFNDKNITPGGMPMTTERRDKNNSRKNDMNITPTGKENTIKENIDNYFINIFQNIFFYGNNGYTNLLKISDNLLKKLRDGVMKYRMNMNDVKDCCIKYISYSIIPIVNDSNTKEYQRQIIKDKISTILEIIKMDRKYFEKDYKVNNDKKDKHSDNRNLNGVNITHSKINEFRKFYELKEKDYPDETIIKALIKFRGNREMAFQYLFY